MKHLVLGGARSGKSQFAQTLVENLAAQQNKQKVYIATAQAGDKEMVQRIEHHQTQRDDSWLLYEQFENLAKRLQDSNEQQVILIDCLTLWLSNCLHAKTWETESQSFIQSIQTCKADIVMVSNEVGSGIVPIGKLSRDFVDNSGWLHQRLAKQCDKVSLIVAGLELSLKA